jgi:pseudomonalisin
MFASKFACWAALSVALAGVAHGQTEAAQARTETPLAAIQPKNRIQGRIDDAQRQVLLGQRHPLATPQNSRGAVGSDLAMEHMVLVLHGDAAQEEALEELLGGQQDPHSAEYHHWLTPDVFGEHFGASASDIEQITSWLRMHGFEVEEISASRRAITFSGTAGQVEETFHTPIQKYVVKGEQHYANALDPEIPETLASVVGGVLSLHDFRSTPMTVKTQYTEGAGTYFLSPKDWSTIYDVAPLYGHGVNGAGQSIAVIGRTNIALSDVRGFRSTFGLAANDPQIIVNGADPGTSSNDQVESSLDVEWAGAIAPNATVKFVTSRSGPSDGVYLSAQYAVNRNLAQIVTVSYGACKKALGTSGNAFWKNLWAQAAAQGMTVFVSSGDREYPDSAAHAALAARRAATRRARVPRRMDAL